MRLDPHRLDAATVRDAARGRWQEILPRLGISAEILTGKHGPCPGCGGRDRFRFDDREGRGTWYCSGGGNPASGDGFGLLAHVHGWDFARALREVAGVLGVEGDAAGSSTPKAPELGPVADLEAAANRELRILAMTLGQRVADREIAKARAFRGARPDWRPVPPEHWEREIQAVRRLLVLLPALYAAELGEAASPNGEAPETERPRRYAATGALRDSLTTEKVCHELEREPRKTPQSRASDGGRQG